MNIYDYVYDYVYDYDYDYDYVYDYDYDYDYYITSKSCKYQYSDPPFGRGRLTMNGIFFSSNSRIAIMYPSKMLFSTLTYGVAPSLSCLVLTPSMRVFSYLVSIGIVR